MQRKRSRSIQKDQHQMGHLPIADAVMSPTSPLDFRVFTNLGNPFRSPRSNNDGSKRSRGSSKVGLSKIDSLDDVVKVYGKVPRSSESKNIFQNQISSREG
ncbi:uncharacterized protein Pyn_31915 [Prunus yedoensis var. nudiflora]|uniref:Uncharacterized protein n=1 Tax=Prunus yedoensis var. nudiflora TaxID=2094558 RepID=A0A314ZCP7_PRUYE|nr:uncharacterized protein Pyn_31915 [Prunus yedoensis var. nudiflora]